MTKNEREIDFTSENPIPVPKAPTGLEDLVAQAENSGYPPGESQ